MLDTQAKSKPSRRWARALFLSSLLGGLSAGIPAYAQNPYGLPQQPAAAQALHLPPLPGTVPASTLPAPAAHATLRTYSIPSQMVGAVGAQLQLKYHADPSVRVTTEPGTGALMIMAPAAVHQQLTQQLSAMMEQNGITAADRSGAAATAKHSSYTLENLSWRELQDALMRLGGSKLAATTDRNGEVVNLQIANRLGTQDVLQIDRRSNVVSFSGAGEEIAGWAEVVRSLDRGQADRVNSTHIVPLAPAAPRKVKQAFQMVKATLLQEQAASGDTEAQVDMGGDTPATAIGTLDDLGTGSGLFGEVQIEFVEEIDLVIIRGSKDDVRRVLEVIEKIKEQAEKTQPKIVVYPLKHANGEAVETLVSELYEEVYAARQGNISITALGQPNALLLIGREQVVNTVQQLVEKIDVPLDPHDQLKVIPLRHASAVDVEVSVRDFFVQTPGNNNEERIALGTRVKVLADYRTNSLIIQASPRELVEVETLIAKLDVETAEAQNDVKIFRLQNALAEDIQIVLEEVIGGQVVANDASQATPPSGKISFVTVDGGRIESGILAGIVVTADTNNNQLVVRAPKQSMALVKQLIEELDQQPGAEARIKVFQLVNGDATTMAQTLQGLFGLEVNAGQGAQGAFLSNATRSNVSTGGESSLVQLQIAAEGRTNSIVVSGSPSDLQVLEALVLRLDEDVVDSRKADVIWLRNATAADVSVALDSYFSGLSQAQQSLNNGLNAIISVAELVNRQVFVVPEVATNSLLLSASPENFEVAMRLIEKLDRRPPLIQVQFLIAEVQLDDGLELGTEWGLQDGLLFDRGSATGGSLASPVFGTGTALSNTGGGVGIPQNVAGQVLSSFGVGRSSSAAGVGGMVLAASSESVGVLVRALQTSNRLQILSRPSITTLDNKPASTLIGSKVPRVTDISQATGLTGQQITTVDEDVGLSIQVQPRVNEDGLILMELVIENSAVGDSADGIPIGFGTNGEVIRSPIISSTSATTTVSAYSGQTVVFAGLISKSRGSTRNQVPILGSLPIIGPAFRFDTESEQRRELLVIVTPRLVHTDEDYEVLKEVESSRMSWCLADVLNVHGDVGLGGGNGLWGPAKSAMIYPEQQPAILPRQSRLSTQPQPQLMEPMYGDPTINGMIQPVDLPTYDAGAANRSNSPTIQPVGYRRPAGN